MTMKYSERQEKNKAKVNKKYTTKEYKEKMVNDFLVELHEH